MSWRLQFLRPKILPSSDLPPESALGCPRVFSEVFSTVTDQNEPLEFLRPRKDLWETADGTIDYRNLIYDASFGGVKMLAKVVLRSYGKDVHAHLAAQHMAPQLYGTSDLEDLASVVVMELLEGGWTTLFDYRHRNGVPEGPRRLLLKRLEDILDCLHARGMVHGDFRMANIMLKPGEEEKAVLIDFDWAGEAGKVSYPVTRSDGFGYHGDPGGVIDGGDDRSLLLVPDPGKRCQIIGEKVKWCGTGIGSCICSKYGKCGSGLAVSRPNS